VCTRLALHSLSLYSFGVTVVQMCNRFVLPLFKGVVVLRYRSLSAYSFGVTVV